jgi:hypothetical protein
MSNPKGINQYSGKGGKGTTNKSPSVKPFGKSSGTHKSIMAQKKAAHNTRLNFGTINPNERLPQMGSEELACKQ